MNPQQEILNYFQAGGSLTVLEALNRFKTTELRRIVSRLRESGHNISDIWIKEENGKRHKRYRIGN